MFFPACITLSLYLDWISCAILSVSHSPSAIFHGQSLSLLSWITKVQYSFVALSCRDHFWDSLEACLEYRNCLNGQKTLGIGNIGSHMWERVVFECCDCTQWNSAFFCSALLCISFLSFFLCFYLVCEPLLSSSPRVCKSFCHFYAQNHFEQGDREFLLEDRCYMTNPLSFDPWKNVTVPVHPSGHD